jgi:single-stranded-DNA-specific exonuclease
MGHAREAVELFTTATPAQAAMIAANLCRLNDQRRSTERRIAEHAAEMARAAGMTGPDRRAIVLAHRDWHAGVIGIVCSRLIEEFHRPTILLQLRDGEAHGSGRSIDGFSLHAALERCSALLLSHGGHDMAAGLRLEEQKLAAFTEAFTAEANAALEVDRLVPALHYDCEATLGELTTETVGKLEMLSPFGMGNPKPRLLVSGLRLDRRPEPFGASSRHLGLMVRQGGRWMRFVAWNWGARRDEVAAGSEFEAIISPKVSGYSRSVEPVLEDLRAIG